MQVKDSLAAFTKSLKQDATASDLVELVSKTVAEKAVVVENGKPVEGFKVRMLVPLARMLPFVAAVAGLGC